MRPAPTRPSNLRGCRPGTSHFRHQRHTLFVTNEDAFDFVDVVAKEHKISVFRAWHATDVFDALLLRLATDRSGAFLAKMNFPAAGWLLRRVSAVSVPEKFHATTWGTASQAFNASNFDANNGASGSSSGHGAVDNPPPAAYYFRPSARIKHASWHGADGSRRTRRQTGPDADKKIITTNPRGELS